MLIDAGAQDGDHEDALIEYLDDFFDRRTDLNETLNSVLITHNHIDHTRALRRIVEEFTVQRYIDNGFTTGSGAGNPNWLRGEVASGQRKIVVRDIPDSAVEAVTDRRGLTDADIDPFRVLGYHDVRLGSEPDRRLQRFIGVNLLLLLPGARDRFERFKDLLLEYATGEHAYKSFAARVKRRMRGEPEDLPEPEEAEIEPPDEWE